MGRIFRREKEGQEARSVPEAESTTKCSVTDAPYTLGLQWLNQCRRSQSQGK